MTESVVASSDRGIKLQLGVVSSSSNLRLAAGEVLRDINSNSSTSCSFYKTLPAPRRLFLGLRSSGIHRRHICRLRWLRSGLGGRLGRPGSLRSTLGIGSGGAPGASTRPDIRLHAKACPAEHGGARGPAAAAPRPRSAQSPGRCPKAGTLALPQSPAKRWLPQVRGPSASSALPPPPPLHDPATLIAKFLLPASRLAKRRRKP